MAEVLPQNFAAARLRLSRERPYLAAALWALQPRAITDMGKHAPGSVGVDRWWRMYYDPVETAGWAVEVCQGVLVHEIGHLLREHDGRATSMGIVGDMHQERLLWNIASDEELNDDLAKDGWKLPEGSVYPKTFGHPDDRLAEEYYQLLKDLAAKSKASGKGKGLEDCGCGSGSGGNAGEHEEATGEGGVSKAEGTLVRQRVAEDVREHAKQRGTVPAWLQRWAEDWLTPKVDWRKMLASLVRRACGDVRGAVDYTYSRPSRRQSVFPKVVLPALRQPVPTVAVVVDTSGSMSDKELGMALAELDGILIAAGQREGVTVLPCDAAVGTVKRVMSKRDVVLDGGGGTDMRVGIDEAVRRRPRPDIVIVVTDGCTPWGSEGPGIPVIICLTQKGAEGSTPEWASVVCIDG